MPSVDHMVIYWDHHHGWIKNNSTENAGIHCWIWLLLPRVPLLMQLFNQLIHTTKERENQSKDSPDVKNIVKQLSARLCGHLG